MESTKKLDYRELSSYKSLFLDYVHDFERLAPFFAGNPQQTESWREVAERIGARSRDQAAMAGVLRVSNQRLGADEKALQSVDALEKGAFAIVTGQQVGLFGGPLYTLYKALTAVALARQAATRLNRPVVPLFWMDADDHDFDEVRSARFVDRQQELATFSYEPSEAQNRVPVADLRLEPVIEDLIHAADDALASSEFKPEVVEALQECYATGRSLPEAFGSFLLRITRGTGLAVVDPTAPELKALASPLFEREATERSQSSGILQQTTAELVSLGYHAQVSTTTDRLNLFYAAPGRFHILSEDSGFRIGADGRFLSQAEMGKLIRAEPHKFSPNVALRSLYQDTLLPTLAYVAGPNELAYFAQLGRLYEHFDVTMPLIAPRASFTVVEKPQLRFLERYGVKFAELRSNDESLLNRILKDLTPPQLEEDMSRARHCVQEITQTLERDLSAVDQTLIPTVRSTRGKLLHHLGELEAKSLRAIKRKDETLRRQFFSTRTSLFPNFDMQERQLSPLQYLAKYGWHFSEITRKAIDLDTPGHILLFP